MKQNKQLKVSVIYYHDLFDKHAGGVLHYVRCFFQSAPKKIKLSYWGRRGGKNTPDPSLDHVKVNYFCAEPKRKIIPELLRVLWHLYRKIPAIQQEADILFFQLSETALPLFFRKKQKPCVLVFHGSNEHINLSHPWYQVLFFRLSDFLAVRKMDLIITVSEEGKKYYSKLYPKLKHKIHYIPTFAENTLAPDATKQKAKELLLFPQQPIISFAGRLNYPKRVEQLLNVFSVVLKKDPNAILVLAGDGPLKQKLQDKAKQMGIQNNVLFLGVLNRKQIGLLFRASDVSVLLTDFEGTPLSVLESLACGTPVIVSDVADHRFIITEGKDGYIVNNSDPDQLIADRINSVLSSPDAFHQHAQKTGEKYLASAIVPKIIKAIEETKKNHTN